MADREIRIRLTADGNYEKVITESTRSTNQYSRSTDRATRETRQFGRATDQTSKALGTFSRAAGVAGAAVAGIFTAQAVRASVEYASAIGRTADILGQSTDELQEQRFAFQRAGGDAQEYLDIYNTLQVAIGDAVRGTATQKDALDALGIAYTDATGRARDAAEVLPELIEAQALMNNQTERAANLNELLGESSRVLLAINREKAASFRDLSDEAGEYGAVLSEEAIANSRELSREFGTLTTVLQATGAELVGAIAPGLTAVIEGLTTMVGWVGQGTRAWLELFGVIRRGSREQQIITDLNAVNRELEDASERARNYAAELTKVNSVLEPEKYDRLSTALNTVNTIMLTLRATQEDLNIELEELGDQADETSGTGGPTGISGVGVAAKELGYNLRLAAEGARVFHEMNQRGANSTRMLSQEVQDLIDLNPDGIFGDPEGTADAWSDSLSRITSDWARFFGSIEEDWARALGSILQGVSSIGTAISRWSSADLFGRIGIAGGILGAGVGLVQSLFGGDNNPPSPELAIGGPGTTTGQRAGTQAVSAFGGFGLRDPRGRDPADQLAQIATLIANTENRIASFLTSEQIGAVQGAGRIELLADSDQQEEVNNIVNQWFKNTLDAIDTTLGDIFDSETIGGLLDPAIGAQIAGNLIEMSDAFQRLGATLSQEVIDAAGGVQEAFELTSNYLQRYFRPDELAEIALERANNVVREQFGDLVDTFGVNANNFREVFEEVSPQGEDLVRWLRLGEALGIAADAEENYEDALNASTDATQDATTATQSLTNEFAQVAPTISAIVGEIDSLNDTLRLSRNTIRDLEGGNQSLIQTYIGQQASVNFLITTLITGVGGLETGIRDFMQSVTNIVGFIDGAIANINQSIQRQQLDIGLDALGSDQARYDFLQEYIDQQTDYLAGLTDPEEIARVTGDIQSAVARQWALLPESERQRLGGDFISFLDSLGIASTGALEATREMVINNATLTIQAATVRIEGLDDQPQQDMVKAGFDMVYAGNQMVTAANRMEETSRRGIKVRITTGSAQNG